MVSGQRRRPLVHPFLVALALGLFAGACSNLALSTGIANDSSPSPPDLHETDAGSGGSDGAYGGQPGPAIDAGSGSTSANPLCGVSTAQYASCDPDLTSGKSACGSIDAGTTKADAGSHASDAGIAFGCHIVLANDAGAPACGLAGSGLDGDSCETGLDCAPSFECVGMPGRCRHYCCDGDKSCGGASSSSFCDFQSTAESNLKVPVCSPVSPCKLLTPNACAPDETCAIVKDNGTTSCVAVGSAQAGDSCDSVHCASGLTCLGRSGARECYKLCRVGNPSDCPGDSKCKGSVQLFNDPSYGICQ